jgi:hypothetical protein
MQSMRFVTNFTFRCEYRRLSSVTKAVVMSFKPLFPGLNLPSAWSISSAYQLHVHLSDKSLDSSTTLTPTVTHHEKEAQMQSFSDLDVKAKTEKEEILL